VPFRGNIIERRRAILDLCGGTGAWSAPFRSLGYETYVVDVDGFHDPDFCMSVQTFLQKIRQDSIYLPPVDIVLAAPPCTHFTNASARLWPEYDRKGLTRQSIDTVLTCLNIIDLLAPRAWALENPRGRLRYFIGLPSWNFQPFLYGDPWSKETHIWGTARKPTMTSRVQVLPMLARLGGKSAKVKTERSRTPPGFARAFAAENRRTW